MINNYRLKSKHNNRDILLDIRFNSKTNNSDLILFVHGFKGFKDWGPFNQVADWFVEQGFAYAKLNLSHNGTTAEHPCDFVDLEAFGNNTFSIELDDLQVVIDFLFSENSQIPSNIWNNKKLHLIGHSRGGGLAVLKAAEESRVSSLITWAGINDLSKRWPQPVLDEWKEKGVLYIFNARTNQDMPLYYTLVEDVLNNDERINIPKAVKKLNIPHLIVHGTNDETLPWQMATEMKAWREEGELFIIDDANHTFGGKHPWDSEELSDDFLKVVEKTLEFIKRV